LKLMEAMANPFVGGAPTRVGFGSRGPRRGRPNAKVAKNDFRPTAGSQTGGCRARNASRQGPGTDSKKAIRGVRTGWVQKGA